MRLIENSVNRVNRLLEKILDQPLVARVTSPVQPIANTLTTRYLHYAIPSGGATTRSPVAYTVIDAEGNTAWQGDTKKLAKHPEYRRHDAP
jgi:hypothetical protein